MAESDRNVDFRINAIDETGKGIRGAEREMTGFLDRMAQKAKAYQREARTSGENALMRVVNGPQGLAGFATNSLGIGLQAGMIEIIGRQMANMTGKMVEMKDKIKAGEIKGMQAFDEFMGDLPLIGGLHRTGTNLGELFGGEKARLREEDKKWANEEMILRTQESYASARTQLTANLNKQIRAVEAQTSIEELQMRPREQQVAKVEEAYRLKVESIKESSSKLLKDDPAVTKGHEVLGDKGREIMKRREELMASLGIDSFENFKNPTGPLAYKFSGMSDDDLKKQEKYEKLRYAKLNDLGEEYDLTQRVKYRYNTGNRKAGDDYTKDVANETTKQLWDRLKAQGTGTEEGRFLLRRELARRTIEESPGKVDKRFTAGLSADDDAATAAALRKEIERRAAVSEIEGMKNRLGSSVTKYQGEVIDPIKSSEQYNLMMAEREKNVGLRRIEIEFERDKDSRLKLVSDRRLDMAASYESKRLRILGDSVESERLLINHQYDKMIKAETEALVADYRAHPVDTAFMAQRAAEYNQQINVINSTRRQAITDADYTNAVIRPRQQADTQLGLIGSLMQKSADTGRTLGFDSPEMRKQQYLFSQEQFRRGIANQLQDITHDDPSLKPMADNIRASLGDVMKNALSPEAIQAATMGRDGPLRLAANEGLGTGGDFRGFAEGQRIVAERERETPSQRRQTEALETLVRLFQKMVDKPAASDPPAALPSPN